jgi:hypothetical protein
VRDQRRHVRQKVSIGAYLYLRGEDPTAIACTLIDLSPGGAQIKIAAPHDLPSEVFLVKDEGEIIYERETIWQKKRKAGLLFRDLCGHSKLKLLRDEMWRAEVIDWEAITPQG